MRRVETITVHRPTPLARVGIRPLCGLVGLACLTLLAGCKTKAEYVWGQEITVTVETPDGPRSGRTVQRVAVTYFETPPLMTTREVAFEPVQGGSLVVDLGDGTLLFGVIGSDELAESVFREDHRYDRKATYDALISLPLPGPKVVEHVDRNGYLQIYYFRFRDPSDPASLKWVDPGNMGASFGAGYGPLTATIKIVPPDTPQDTDRILTALPWLEDFQGALHFEAGVPWPAGYLDRLDILNGTRQ